MNPRIKPQNYSFYVLSNYALVLGMAVHAAFLLVFLLFNIPLMVWVNVLSIAFYVGGLYLNRAGYQGWSLILFTVEIVTHALVATVAIGYDAGFHYYCLMLGLCLFLYYRKQFIFQILFAGLLMGFYVWLGIHFRGSAPLFTMLDFHVTILYFFNIAIVFFALALVGFYYSRASVEYVEEMAVKVQEIEESKKEIEKKSHILEEQLSMARIIQSSLIPMLTNRKPGVDFASVYHPMEQIGGDYFDVIEFREEGKVGIFVSDVSGHGVPAALVASMLKIIIDTAGVNKLSPSKLLIYINDRIKGLIGGHFLTAFYGIYDPRKQTLLYGRASHNYPFLIRKEGNEIALLRSKGRILGIMDDIVVEEKEVELNHGDKILFYTDGLTEATSPSGFVFEERLPRIIGLHRRKPIKKMVEEIYSDLIAFRGSEKFEDDVCIIGMEII